MLLYLYNQNTDKIITCQAYTSKNHFISDKCLACEVDNQIYYVPIDEIKEEYDSTLRARINLKDYQICKNLPVNIVNKYFPGSNLLIPLTSIKTLYKLFVGLLGEFHVQLCENGILLKAPITYSGLTKIFLTGLNISFSYNDVTLSTTYNGLSDKIYIKDNLFSRSMLIQLIPGITYLISFHDNFNSFQYNNELVKNFMIIGYEVEYLHNSCNDYYRLIMTDEYSLYNEEKHCIDKIGKYSEKYKYIQFIKDEYLKKDNTLYNYFVLKNPICE